MRSKVIFALVTVFLLYITNVNSLPKFTSNEQQAIQRLRQKLGGSLYQDYMKEDVFLIRWLRARDMDVQEASKMFKEAVNWRKENRIDSILQEEILQLHSPIYYTDGFDNTGSPVATFIPSRIDIRKYVVNGKSYELGRYFDQFIEFGEVGLRSLAKNNSAITQGTIIYDLQGYNLRQHACLGCIGLYLDWLRHYENYYPGLCKNLLMINTPRIFMPLLEILKPVMSKATRKVLKVFGPNKQEWVSFLQTFIPRNQLRPQFGGTMLEY